MKDFLSEDRQILIEHIWPQIDCGRYAVKRTVGDTFEVEADIFRDGHDLIAATVLYRQVSGRPQFALDLPPGETPWQEAPMRATENDRWRGEFPLAAVGSYRYRIQAWTDHFGSWRRDMEKRIDAGQVTTTDVLEGVALVEAAAGRMPTDEASRMAELVARVQATACPLQAGQTLLGEEAFDTLSRYPDRSHASVSGEFTITVDPVLARFSSWYELFPRSQGQPGVHGTFQDVIAQLPRIARMGFDVLYLPPIHPIGRTNRKGPNNALEAGQTDIGSPWAIGNELGGHKAIDPALGTFEDFAELVEAVERHGMKLAMDYAIQTSPDHPYVRGHPEWYFRRPDNTIKHAENPPKRYEDIYPINFYTAGRGALWEELKSVLLFWIERGVSVFRVDNPHTKPIPFWEWLIGEVKREHPETILLAEAFTRPAVMKALAKVGFTQAYTYFTWRVTRWELTEYLTELTQSEMKEYFRGNLWPNTPDILHEFLQLGGIPAFKIRLILAATLSSDYGIYSGYELGVNSPVHPGSEEYLNSDKFQINYYDWNQPHSLEGLIGRVNAIRRANPALQLYDNLRFYASGNNDNILVYGKATPDGRNRIVVAVNLDPFHAQDTWVGLPYWEWGFAADEPYQVHDLLAGETYIWRGEYNYVRLDPAKQPAHVLLVSKVGVPTPDFREIDFS